MIIKKTTLEASDDIKNTLQWKVDTLQSKGMQTGSGIADYIANAVNNIENEIDYISSMEQEYKQRKKELKEQAEKIKTVGAEFFQEMGVVKIEGINCSSITVTKGKDEKVETHNEKVFTPLISQAEIEELLIGLGKAEMQTQTIEKKSKHIPPKLRINKRQNKAA